MTSANQPNSLQALLKQRQQSIFVEREPQLDLFRRNLLARSPNLRDYFIFNVWGQGSVGKSTLLRQFRKLATATGFVTALTNDAETSVTEESTITSENCDGSVAILL